MSRHYAACDIPLRSILASLPESARHLVLCGPWPSRDWLSEGGATVTRWTAAGDIMAHAGAVRIASMAQWGQDPMEPEAARALHTKMCKALSRAFCADPVPLVSPAVCGMHLWRGTAPARGVAPLSAEQQHLIRSTTCQRRDESFPHAAGGETQVWDGRFMYGALLERLPVGPAVRHALEWLPPDYVGRVRVRFRVPGDWAHIGLLAAPGKHRAWEWPAAPGREAETWCDASEARLALREGWEVTVLEGLRLQEGRPLDAWARRLVGLWDRTREADVPLSRAARAVVLQTLGAFQGVGRVEERDRGWIGPRSAPMRAVESVRLEPAAAQAAIAHPEWTAAVWSRCRLRVAKALLSVPYDTVLAVHTDALHLSADPGWTDDGKPGRFRRQESR